MAVESVAAVLKTTTHLLRPRIVSKVLMMAAGQSSLVKDQVKKLLEEHELQNPQQHQHPSSVARHQSLEASRPCCLCFVKQPSALAPQRSKKQ
jgi:hypothetical protein